MQLAGNRAGQSKKLVNAVACAVVEQLEERRLLNGIVVAPTQVAYDGSGPLSPQPGKTFWINRPSRFDPQLSAGGLQ
jgi:hypothetical protein